MKTIGVVGGVGPYAGLDLAKKIFDNTEAQHDQEHLDVLLVNSPRLINDRTAYFHNNQLFTYPGQHVSRGQLIALSGSTGNSTGPHIHFEVRDLLTPWHSVDPYGWTGPGKDPWRWDLGYLWTSNPPVPFLLPLAFPSGAHWNYWYGIDGPPPPVSWRLRDGGRGLAGFAARWDADPGVAAGRTLATSGSAAVPGPGAHTLHLRVFDRAGTRVSGFYLPGQPAARIVVDNLMLNGTGSIQFAGSSLLLSRHSPTGRSARPAAPPPARARAAAAAAS